MMRKLALVSLLLMTATAQSLSPAAAQTTVTLYPVADNYADSKYPDLGHYGKVANLYVGNSYDHGQDIWGSERIYIRFDLSKLARNRIIVQATLSLWQFYAPKSNQTYETYRVLEDWNETTQNWNNQPPSSLTRTSETIAPNWTDIAVEWDITSDVRAWYNQQAPNYGTMIKVATEEHARDASSGFWSREYPVGSHEEWKPKLIIILQGDPTIVYTVTVGVSGLPKEAMAAVVIDGDLFRSISSARIEELIFDRGTTHTIAVSGFVSGSTGVRYRCDANETRVSAASSHVFAYSREYWVSFSTEPGDMFQTPPNGWYGENVALQVKRTGPDVIDTGLGVRLAFDGWHVNEERLQSEPETIAVNEPTTVRAEYRTEYYLNVTSPFARTIGSGWYAKDSLASFSVDPPAVPAEGLLGLLGLKHSFAMWVGSGSSISFPSQPDGTVIMKEPTTLVAIWQDDWASLVVNLAVLLVVVAAVGVAVIVRARKYRSRTV